MASEGHWQPPTDVYEAPDKITVYMEVAGVEPSSIEVHFEHGQLFASGCRTVGRVAGRCHQAEIENGRFLRCVAIPVDVDEENVRATYRHGLLEIVLPRRKEEMEPRKIAISDESEE
jgi:HSP20 family protein